LVKDEKKDDPPLLFSPCSGNGTASAPPSPLFFPSPKAETNIAEASVLFFFLFSPSPLSSHPGTLGLAMCGLSLFPLAINARE